MQRLLWNAGIFASGAAGAVVSFHQLQNLYHVYTVCAESPNHETTTHSSNLDLELKQVQVFFRHGARTPLHVLEGYRQVPYNVDFVMRPHHLTSFPYERVQQTTGLTTGWSPYEESLRRKNLLFGESIPGHLTTFGQEQMYNLGLRIRETYGKQLGLSTFDPDALFVLSTNITRTVESAKCVMAGMYGKDELKRYASHHGPIKIPVCAPEKNILIPDTRTCLILRQVNHSALLHFDFVSSMKADREVVEKHIDDSHDVQQSELSKAQDRVNKALQNKTVSTTTQTFNADRQPYTHNKPLHDAIRQRNLTIEDVSHFWHNAITHHPTLGKHLTKEESRVLLSVKQIDVEEFHLRFKKGYRLRFHFDSNPYFYNEVITKEITRLADGNLVSTGVTDINWKKGKHIEPGDKSTTPSDDSKDESNANTFFSWFYKKHFDNVDTFGDGLMQVWQQPLDFYRHVSYKMDHSTTKKLNFVFLYDDMTSRITHGWWCHEGLQQFHDITKKNGTRMMFYAMTGRHRKERPVVTKLAIGRLLTDMVDRAEGVMKGQNSQQFCLYSSHDSTLVAFLESLGLWQNTWPPFGADVRLEIYKDRKSSDYYVKVVYLGQPVKLRGLSDSLLRWDDFRRVAEPYMITQDKFDEVCSSNFLEEVAKDVLEHEEGEAMEEKKSKRISETPAGM